MFERTSDAVLRSSLLAELPWVRHGFGSRQSEAWPGDYTHLKQVHSDFVFVIGPETGCAGSGDALITGQPGKLIGIRTADCIPILIADPDTRTVAAIHAGWRGTVARIAVGTVRRMSQEFGTDPATLRVAMGPCIGPCCFEVGAEVAQQFEPWFPGAHQLRHIDLVEANRLQLRDEGVLAQNIDINFFCTACSPAEFHSWRRDRQGAGRMVSAIGIV